MVDTNCDPRDVDYLIPSNDDASKSINIIMTQVCDAVAEGLAERKSEKHSDNEGDDDTSDAPKKRKEEERISEKAPDGAVKAKKSKPEGKDRTTEIEEAPVVAAGNDTPKPTPETVETKAPPVVAKTPKPEIDVEATKEVVAEEKEAPKKEKSVKSDDLTKIEGVGPKAAEAMVAAGIDTYANLAKADADKIKEILTESSSRMAHLDPTSWPKQAQMAADGKWDELQEWQDNAKGGVE